MLAVSTQLVFFQPLRCLLRIFHFREPRISVLPEFEEFLVVFDGFG
jgi:hypothetical protein